MTPARHLIEPPPPLFTATIPPKLVPFKVFSPPVPVPVKVGNGRGVECTFRAARIDYMIR